jgi:hypothetical protein
MGLKREQFVEWAEDQLRPRHLRKCPTCDGDGFIYAPPPKYSRTCDCGGSGKLVDNSHWLRQHGYYRWLSSDGKVLAVSKTSPPGYNGDFNNG